MTQDKKEEVDDAHTGSKAMETALIAIKRGRGNPETETHTNMHAHLQYVYILWSSAAWFYQAHIHIIPREKKEVQGLLCVSVCWHA